MIENLLAWIAAQAPWRLFVIVLAAAARVN
jgi:hypothetical protein